MNRFSLAILFCGALLSGPVSAGAELFDDWQQAAVKPAIPSSVANGTYTCGTLLSGSIAGPQMGTTIGQMNVVAPGVYTSLVKEGKGSRAAFKYDAASGKIEWEGGKLSGFFAKVVESRYSLDNRGKPLIKVIYRVREGGNLFDLSCQ